VLGPARKPIAIVAPTLAAGEAYFYGRPLAKMAPQNRRYWTVDGREYVIVLRPEEAQGFEFEHVVRVYSATVPWTAATEAAYDVARLHWVPSGPIPED